MNLLDKFRSKQEVKPLEKVDLSTIPSDRPKRASKEETESLKRMSELREEIHNQEVIIEDLKKKYDVDDVVKLATERKQAELKVEYLKQRCVIREKYNDFSLSNDERQKTLNFHGIRPQHMDVVGFVVPGQAGMERMSGVALVRDENHYYIAVDLFPQPDQKDNITTCMQENPDNTFEGIWPTRTCLREANPFETRMMRRIVDDYADDIQSARDYLNNIQDKEEEEIEKLEETIKANTILLDEYGKTDAEIHEHEAKIESMKWELEDLESPKTEKEEPVVEPEPLLVQPADVNDNADTDVLSNESQQTGADSDDDDDDPFKPDEYVPTKTEVKYPHLRYVRNKTQMLDMTYPQIDYKYSSWLRYRLMGNVARLFFTLARQRSLTYVLSQEYMEELVSRSKVAYRGMMPQDVVAQRELATGVIVFPHQGHMDTVLYEISHDDTMSIKLAYMRERKLLFYESYSEQKIIGNPRIDNYLCQDMVDAGTDVARLFGYVRNMVVSFLAMERDIDRTMKNFVADGKGVLDEKTYTKDDAYCTENDEDVVVRDANWYTSISLDHIIPVNGYVSHRWCGKGKNKILTEVWVRPHERSGYHREAGAKKTNVA